MKNISYCTLFLVSFLFFLTTSCEEKTPASQELEISQKQNEKLFHTTLEKHLKAVADKDYLTLQSTLSPKGNMELIQPGAEIVYTADGFMEFHEEWFAVPDWTVKIKILSTNIGDRIGVATTEFLYQEPERNGKPYFNRLIVSYTLEKVDGNWYFIKDHASSIEKTKNELPSE